VKKITLKAEEYSILEKLGAVGFKHMFIFVNQELQLSDVYSYMLAAMRGGKSEIIRINQNKSEKIRENQGKPGQAMDGLLAGKGGGAMDRSGFILLSVLERSGALGRVTSMTVGEIAQEEDLGIGGNTIYKKLRAFEQSGLVGRGLKEGRAATFFLTGEGRRRLEEERSRE